MRKAKGGKMPKMGVPKMGKAMPSDEHPMKKAKSKMPTPKSDKSLLMRTKMH